MPETAEVDPLVGQLEHGRDQRIAVETPQEWIFLHLSELAGKGQLLLRGQPLIAKKQHLALQPQRMHSVQGCRPQGLGKIPPADFGSDRGREEVDLEMSVHGFLAWITQPCSANAPSSWRPS